MAVAALITGLLLLGPVALALGLVALRRTRRRGTRGRGLAVAGLVLGGLGTLGLVAGGVVAVQVAEATRPLPGDVTAPRQAHALQLVTGSCLDPLPASGDVDVVSVVPCADPHAAQVLTQYRFDADAVWPGQAHADARVAEACQLSALEEAAGVRALTWAPTETSWERGDRTGLCLATVEGGGLTGSFLDGSVVIP
ncbi:DUF4190 domain-containing protein [Cellulomonas sp. P22]|uniref:DUF4190 domain-containing protein n=1 Tax=Cellulomonas sp. P22 TaxID=3373189 RepID=UPI0037971AC0